MGQKTTQHGTLVDEGGCHRGATSAGGPPLDDVYVALKDVIPHLSRSSLHLCLQPHGLRSGRLPKTDREKPKKFKTYDPGYFHIDDAELRHEAGKACLYVAGDPTFKLVFARIFRRATKLAGPGAWRCGALRF